MAAGTFLMWARMMVRPASCSLMAACGLAFEGGVEKRELPAGRGFARHDAVLAAIEVQVFGFVADVVQTREAGADVEVHVGEIAVLRNMEADADRGGVAVLDFEIDVAHRGVKGSGIGVGDVGGWWDDSLLAGRGVHGPGWSIAAGAATGEEDHVADSLLVAWGIFAEDDDGAGFGRIR